MKNLVAIITGLGLLYYSGHAAADALNRAKPVLTLARAEQIEQADVIAGAPMSQLAADENAVYRLQRSEGTP